MILALMGLVLPAAAAENARCWCCCCWSAGAKELTLLPKPFPPPLASPPPPRAARTFAVAAAAVVCGHVCCCCKTNTAGTARRRKASGGAWTQPKQAWRPALPPSPRGSRMDMSCVSLSKWWWCGVCVCVGIEFLVKQKAKASFFFSWRLLSSCALTRLAFCLALLYSHSHNQTHPPHMLTDKTDAGSPDRSHLRLAAAHG